MSVEVPVLGRPSKHHPLGSHIEGQKLMRTQVSKGAMRSGVVVGLTVALAQDLRLSDRGEEFSVQEFVAKSRVKRLTLSILPPLSGQCVRVGSNPPAQVV